MKVLLITVVSLAMAAPVAAQMPTRSRSSGASTAARTTAPAPAASSSGGASGYSAPRSVSSYSGYRAGYGGYGYRGGGYGGGSIFTPLPPMTRVRVAGGAYTPVLVQRRCYGSVVDLGYVAANMSFLYPLSWMGRTGAGCYLRFQTLGCSPFDYYGSSNSRRRDVYIKGVRMTPTEGYETTAVSATSFTASKEALKALQKGRKALFGSSRNLVAAQERLEEAVALHPKFAEAWTLLGLTRMTRGDQSGAVEALEKSIEADSMYGAPYAPLAKTLIRQSNYRRALETADRGVELNPGDSDLKYALVVSAFALKQTDTARRWAQQLYDSGEADYYPTAIYVLATAAREAGRNEQAARLFEEYLDRPGNARLRRMSEDGLKEALLAAAEVEAQTLIPKEALIRKESGGPIVPVVIESPSKQ